MTIALTTSPGGLFRRLGKIGKQIKDINVWQLGIYPTTFTEIVNQYENIAGPVTSLPELSAPFVSQRDAGRLAAATITTAGQTLAIATLNRMVNDDNPQANASLVSLSMSELIRQMKVSADTVKVCAITISFATVPGYTNTGNGTVNTSTKRGDGLVNENSFAETGSLVCTNDAQIGATAGYEVFQFSGDAGQSSPFHYLWPLGAGSGVSLNSIDATKDNTSGNLLKNSGFEVFTVANTPDNWSIVVGVAGTDIFSEASIKYSGTKALRFAGGATLTSIKQQFNVASNGTPGKLGSQSQYSVAVWLKVDVVPAAGALTIELIDGANAVINDDQGVANSFTVALTGITTTFTAYKGVFRMPKVLPAAQYIRMRLSTALSAGSNLYIDHLGMGLTTRLYIGGPSLAVHSGSTNWIQGDKFDVPVTNDRGGASNLATFQTLFDRLFGMRAMDMLLPSAGSPTIADSLFT